VTSTTGFHYHPNESILDSGVNLSYIYDPHRSLNIQGSGAAPTQNFPSGSMVEPPQSVTKNNLQKPPKNKTKKVGKKIERLPITQMYSQIPNKVYAKYANNS
jgi:hypothetical protein